MDVLTEQSFIESLAEVVQGILGDPYAVSVYIYEDFSQVDSPWCFRALERTSQIECYGYISDAMCSDHSKLLSFAQYVGFKLRDTIRRHQ